MNRQYDGKKKARIPRQDSLPGIDGTGLGVLPAPRRGRAPGRWPSPLRSWARYLEALMVDRTGLRRVCGAQTWRRALATTSIVRLAMRRERRN